MARRKKREADIFELIGPILALVFVLVSFLAFTASGGDIHRMGQIFGAITTLFWTGIMILVLVIVVATVGFFVFQCLNRANLPSKPSSPQPIAFSMVETAPTKENLVGQLRAIDWYQFEKVVGLVYQSQGYALHRRGGANPDGGIDLIIEYSGEQVAVQCKRWKKWKVKEPLIREFVGALTIAKISRGVVVALNGSTTEAKQLAATNNIDIIHGEDIAAVISELPADAQQRIQALLQDERKYCPKCESVMVLRTPEPGKNWTQFWGCSRYPTCRGKLEDG
jgi:hypothetical protein